MGVILWLSDLHLDPYYGTKLAASHKNGKHCSFNATLKNHPYGQVGCDAPPSLLTLTLEHAASSNTGGAAAIDFVLITGDFARHEMNNLFSDPSSDLVLFPTVKSILSTCIQTIRDSLPDVPILPVIGNNDLVPDYYLDEEDEEDEEAHEMLLSIANGLTETFLDDNEFGHFVDGGYFSRLVPLASSSSSILVLSLNTILYSTRHEPEYSPGNLDPYGQFKWLKGQLHRAAAAASTSTDSKIVGIYLAGHIPPSIGSYRHTQLWHEEYIQEFSTILKDYTQGKFNPPNEDSTQTPPTILGNFYGHVHTEEFRLFHYGLESEKTKGDDEKLATSSKLDDSSSSTTEALVVPVLVTSSITPIYGSNPSYRLVEFSDETGALLDYKTHYLDLDKATAAANHNKNKNKNNKPNHDPWIALPSFVQDYGLPDLSLNSFQQLFQNFENELAQAVCSAAGSSHNLQNATTTSSTSSSIQNAEEERLWETFWKRQNLYSNTPDDGDDNMNNKSETEVMIDWLCTFGSSTTQDYQGCLQTKQEQLSKDQCETNGAASRLFRSNSISLMVLASVAACIGLVLLFLGLFNCYKRRSKRKLYTIPQENDHDLPADGVFVEDHAATIPSIDIELI